MRALIYVMCAVLMFGSMAWAVDLREYTGSAFYAAGSGYYIDPSGSFGPYSDSDTDPNDASVGLGYYGSYSQISSYNSAWFGGFEHSVGQAMGDFMLNAQAYVDSSASSPDVATSGEASTQPNGGSVGYFFEIISTRPGEQIGDEVTVDFQFPPYISFSGSGAGYQAYGDIKGPAGMDHFAVTRNQLPPVIGAPDPAKEVWTHANMHVTETVNDIYDTSFTAAIGDVIGVYMTAEAHAQIAAAGYASANVSAHMYFIVTVDSNPMDFNNDGYVDMEDFATFANEWLWIRGGR